MNNPTEMAKTSATGSFHLLWGLITSTLISSIGTIFIANLLGSDQYGLYTIVLTAPSLISILRDWGINTAMTRFTAQYHAENRTNEIRSILTAGIIFETTIGTTLSIILLTTANTIATTAFNRPETTPLIQLASITILANGLINAATAAFVGIEKLTRNSIMLIFQATIKTTLVIALVLTGQGTTGAITGYTTALLIAGTTGILLLWPIYKNLPKPQTNKLHLKAYLQTMLQYGIPLSLSNIILGFQTQFFNFLLPIYVAENAAIGNFGIATTFSVLITFFATPITTMLLPAFSKLDHKKDNQTLQSVFQHSIKWASLFVIPPTTIVMALAEPAVTTLFHDTYTTAPLFLALLSITYLYTAFGSLSVGNLINAQGDTTYNLKLAIITATIGFPMGYILIMHLGVLGLITTTLVSSLPSLFIAIRWIKKHYNITIDWTSSAKILLTSATAATPTYITATTLLLPSWLRLIIGLIIFIAVFLPTAVITKTITKTDTKNLREMLSAIHPIQKITNLTLTTIDKLIDTLKP